MAYGVPSCSRVEESMSVDHRQQCNCHDLSHGHHETEPIYIQVKWGLEADETYIGGKSHGTQKLRAEKGLGLMLLQHGDKA